MILPQFYSLYQNFFYMMIGYMRIQDLMILLRLKTYLSTMAEKGITNRQECLQLLKKLQIPLFKVYEHDAVFNMEEMAQKVHLEKSPLIKSLLFSDKKPDQHYMILAAHQTKPEKAFWKKVGTTHNNVRMSKQEVLEQVLKSKKGALNPFSLANDSQHHIKTLIIEDKLFNFDYWAFHPMDNSVTVQLAREDFLKFLGHFKVNFQKLDISEALQKNQPKQKQKKQGGKQQNKQGMKKEEVNLLGISTPKSGNFSAWYQEAIIRSGLIEFYDVSGCYILRPWAYTIWEKIQGFFDRLIKENGVEPCYFPMFVSERALQLQKDHVQGFAPQVAWVTRSGQSELNQPIAIRPTSETIMYPAYAKWIKSHRDLPLKLNQWTNIVRWQFKHPTPFIRTRQFLWQQGHTAHATLQQAQKQMFDNLQFYYRVYTELLALPMCKGIKTQSQKFPGGHKTSTIQTWIPQNGRAIQAATSHNLGQNFAKMFNIQFQDQKKEKKLAWQTSWGLTTRSIGILVMYHGDDKGLVLPPKVAQYQVVIIPIPFKGKEELVNDAATDLFKRLKKTQVRVHVDTRDNYNPGWKYNHWELKGVPIRLELGPKDLEKQQVRAVIRHSGQKLQLKWDELEKQLPVILDKIQANMYEKALQRFNSKIAKSDTWDEFMKCLNKKNVVQTPWCDNSQCQKKVKERSGIQSKDLVGDNQAQLTGQAKTLCIPLNQTPLEEGAKCFHCGKDAKCKVLWGRSY